MNPRLFQATFVDGNIAEFRDRAYDLRRAANAIWAIDALAAHVYEWAKQNAPEKIRSSIKEGDTGYRDELAGQSEGFRLLPKFESVINCLPMSSRERFCRRRCKPYGSIIHSTVKKGRNWTECRAS